MFSPEQWLMLLALITLLFQGQQLRAYDLSKTALLLMVFLPILTLSLSEYLARQSVIALQQTLLAQSQFMSAVVLLEALLTCFVIKGYKFPLVSMLLAVVYGQMLFYQTGWFSWSFNIQGAVYGLCISMMLILTTVLARQSSRFPPVIIGLLLMVIFLQLAQWPPARQFEVVTDYSALGYCLGGVISLLLIGYVIGQYKPQIEKYSFVK